MGHDMNIDFWSKQKTFSLYEVGFLMLEQEPVTLREHFFNPNLNYKHKLEIPSSIIEEEEIDPEFPIPAAWMPIKSRYVFEHMERLGFDSETVCYYQWRYGPVSLSMAQRAIFSDLIIAVQRDQ